MSNNVIIINRTIPNFVKILSNRIVNIEETKIQEIYNIIDLIKFTLIMLKLYLYLAIVIIPKEHIVDNVAPHNPHRGISIRFNIIAEIAPQILE